VAAQEAAVEHLAAAEEGEDTKLAKTDSGPATPSAAPAKAPGVDVARGPDPELFLAFFKYPESKENNSRVCQGRPGDPNRNLNKEYATRKHTKVS